MLKARKRFCGYGSDPDGGPILLGADPEWEAWDPRSRYIVRPMLAGAFDAEDGSVGVDGSGLVPEARPDPTDDPYELYARIVRLMREWETRTRCRACLSGHTYAIGCHIHVGAPSDCVLDGHLYRYVVHLDRRVGDLVRLSGRARGGYASRREWRYQPHGLEYRTLPSCILALEDVAVWVFAVAYAFATGRTPPRRSKRVTSAISAIADAVQAGTPFGFGLVDLRTLSVPACVDLSDDYWCVEWRDWAFTVSVRAIRPVRLFGYAATRGNITNDSWIAEQLGWEYVDDPRNGDIGLPRSARLEMDERVARVLEQRLIQLGYLQEVCSV
jgi:hypothetical protein